MENIYLKFGVYGENRVGKSTLACTFPKPLLVVSFEVNLTGGALSIRRVPGVDFKQVTTTEEGYRLAGWLGGEGRGAYKTVVLDSVTSYQDVVLKEILNIQSLPEQMNFGGVSGDEYRARSERTKEGLRPFLNLETHTVVIAKEMDHNPPKEEKLNPKTGKLQPDLRPKFVRGVGKGSYYSFALGGATAGWLFDQLDYVGRLYLDKEVKIRRIERKLNNTTSVEEVEEETGRNVRRLLIQPIDHFAAGFRSEVPENVPTWIEQPSDEERAKGVTWYDKILAVVRAGEGN